MCDIFSTNVYLAFIRQKCKSVVLTFFFFFYVCYLQTSKKNKNRNKYLFYAIQKYYV